MTVRVCGACKGAGLARYHPPAQRAHYQGAHYWYSGDPVERICRACGGTGITGLDDVESLNRCLDVQAKLLRFAAIATGDQHDQIGSLRAELRDLAERATELIETAERLELFVLEAEASGFGPATLDDVTRYIAEPHVRAWFEGEPYEEKS